MARFHKMHGLGNDFVLFDARDQAVALTPILARAVADRNTGIGCDQVILIESTCPGVSLDDPRNPYPGVSMRIWNADGSEVGACGNAARCVAALTGGGPIRTAGGLLDGEALAGGATVTLPPPHFDCDGIPLAYPADAAALPVAWGPLERPAAVNVGNPHLVFFVDDPAAVPLDELGPEIEHDPLFPERINVNVASASGDAVTLRTWERGVGLTRACGTGACATAVAAIRRGLASSPVTVHMPGGALTIAWAPGAPIRMTGPATHVFTGEIDLEALLG